ANEILEQALPAIEIHFLEKPETKRLPERPIPGPVGRPYNEPGVVRIVDNRFDSFESLPGDEAYVEGAVLEAPEAAGCENEPGLRRTPQAPDLEAFNDNVRFPQNLEL